MPVGNILKQVWNTLRTLCGDDAYERYLAHWRARHGEEGDEPLGREQFFKAELERKWSGVKRCC